MAKIKGFKLNDQHLQLLKSIVRELKPGEIRELADLVPHTGSRNTDELKKIIAAELDKEIDLNQRQIEILYKYAPARRLFDFLPVSLLRDFSAEIATEIGIPVFELLILLSNKTEELKDKLGVIRPVGEERVKEFKEELVRKIRQGVYEPLRIDFYEAGENVRQLRTENIELRNQISNLEQTIESLNKSHYEELKELRQKIVELNNQIASLIAKNANLEEQKQEVADQLSELKEQYEDLRTNFEERVKKETEKKFGESLRAWFPQAFEVENEAHRDLSDVFAYAGQALERQQEQDRNFGNRTILLKRLNELNEIRARLSDALENALNPVPELHSAISMVDGEINRLRSLLGLETDKNKVQEMLMALVNAASDLNEYERIMKFAEYLKEKGFVDDHTFKKIWDALYSRYTINIQQHPTAETAREQSIRRKLRANEKCIIILDAHNIILHDMLKHRLRAPFQEQSRNNLLQLIKPLADGRGEAKFIVVFDGSYPHEENISPNVQIVFSGGEGEHRADVKIVELVRMNPGMDLFVVTDDEELIRDVKHYGAQPVKVLMFMWILQEFGVLPPTFLGWA